MRCRWPGPPTSLSKHRPGESGGRSEQTGWALRNESLRTLRSTQQSRGDGIQHECIERRTGHMQAGALTFAGLAAILLARGIARNAFMARRHGVVGAFRLGASSRIRRTRRHLHLMMMGRAHLGGGADRHGMAQLADDQTAHQQENQGPALPEKLTHASRLPVQTRVAQRGAGCPWQCALVHGWPVVLHAVGMH